MAWFRNVQVPCNKKNVPIKNSQKHPKHYSEQTWYLGHLGTWTLQLFSRRSSACPCVFFFWNQGRQAIYGETIKQPLTAIGKFLSTYCLSFTDSPTALHQWHPCSWWSCILAAVICSFGMFWITSTFSSLVWLQLQGDHCSSEKERRPKLKWS